MGHLKLFEEYDKFGYKSHWKKFISWLDDKDFDLYDGKDDLKEKFLNTANDDSLSCEEKSEIITDYLEDKWGLYGGYEDVYEYLDKLFFDEV